MKFIQIASYTYPHEAYFAKSLLEAGGINCVLKDELTIQANNFYSNAIGGVKLLVLEEEKEFALSILNDQYVETEVEDLPKDNDLEETRKILICPNCTSTNVGAPRLKGAAALISILLLGFPFPFLIKKAHCFDCGLSFKP